MSHRTPNHVTATDIERALATCDELGVDQFLADNKFGAPLSYQLRHRGRSYPLKAIVGVAAGMTAREFSGGAAHCGRVVERLGFRVRRGIRAELSSMARKIVGALRRVFPFGQYERPNLPIDPSCFFASGANHAGDIRGFAAAGHDVGVAVNKLSERSIVALEDLAGTDVQVFVDSGAFSEVVFDADGPRVVKPITDEQWRKRLAIYKRLAIALGDQVHVVAPDMVGFQSETLDRLATYRDELREIAALGARVLVVLQLGAKSQTEFYADCCDLLGFEFTPSLPAMKAATSPSQAAEFVAAVQPLAVHLLGVGASNKLAGQYLTAIADASPTTMIQLDACVIRRLAGNTNGRAEHGGKRRATYALDLVRKVIGAEGCGVLAKEAQIALALGRGTLGNAQLDLFGAA